MADEEMRQMFRELLATQKEYLELLRQISETQQAQAQAYRDSFQRTEKEFIELARRQNEKYEAQVQTHAENAELYKRSLQPRPWEIAYRAVVGIGILLLLVYLAIRV